MVCPDEKTLLKDLATSRGGQAFSSLYDFYSGKCFTFIKSMTKDTAVAKDLTHDIFVKIWLRRDLISKTDSFSSYLFRMTRNAVFDHYEHNTIRRKYVARQTMLQEEFREYVDEKMNLDDLQLMISRSVDEMPKRRREIFTMSRYNGLSNKEIAQFLGIDVRTVENHITNALADLRVALAKN